MNGLFDNPGATIKFSILMRYAFISDIHGNLEALQAVLEDAEKEKVEEIYCLGDIVGYYPDPNACIKIIQERCRKSVAGNHDYAALGKIDIHSSFTYYACVAMEWTRENLTEESISFLTTLPLTRKIGNDMVIAHSTPHRPDRWDYIFLDSYDLVADAFSSFRQRICLVAHTHYPAIITLRNDRIILHRDREIKISKNHQYLVNVGSVGQSRDGDPRSCYAIYDDSEQQLFFRRVKYDLKLTQKKVRHFRLPEFLAVRLGEGR